MYRNKNIVLTAVLLLLLAIPAASQELVVYYLNESGDEAEKQVFEVGDEVIIAHQKKGKAIHFFQGKVTGIFKDRNKIRVFDYARSTRVVPIAGKKIDIGEIVGIKRMELKSYQNRERGAVAATISSTIGAAIGGKAGDAIGWGSAAASIGIDLATREQISKQKIKVEIEEI